MGVVTNVCLSELGGCGHSSQIMQPSMRFPTTTGMGLGWMKVWVGGNQVLEGGGGVVINVRNKFDSCVNSQIFLLKDLL